ncbi:hypothetical protein G6F22_016614 [Rhizopus arrhizus]|nr:hypothetical protein G6F22_016614 [Rhizopus arrhizus]
MFEKTTHEPAGGIRLVAQGHVAPPVLLHQAPALRTAGGRARRSIGNCLGGNGIGAEHLVEQLAEYYQRAGPAVLEVARIVSLGIDGTATALHHACDSGAAHLDPFHGLQRLRTGRFGMIVPEHSDISVHGSGRLQHQDGRHPAQVERDVGQDTVAVLQPAMRRKRLGPHREHPRGNDAVRPQTLAHGQAVQEALIGLPEGDRSQPIEYPNQEGQLLQVHLARRGCLTTPARCRNRVAERQEHPAACRTRDRG